MLPVDPNAPMAPPLFTVTLEFVVVAADGGELLSDGVAALA